MLLCFFAALSFGQNSAPAKSNATAATSDADTIRQIEDDWAKVEETTDVAVLERVLADDYVNLTPRGLGPGKAELLRNLRPKAGQTPPYTVKNSNMQIHVFGDAAVAAYVKTYTAKENGNLMQENTTHVFTRDHGSWKLRLSRATVCP
jgi:ketosteroid isomerase-like protein